MFWQGKKVFLTGHTGFKGGWLSLWLSHLGAEVTGYALAPPTNPNFFEATHLADRVTSYIGDIRDQTLLKKRLETAAPEIVIHMAAQPLVRFGYAHPIDTYSTNVMGLVNLYEAIRQTQSVKAIVNVTSDKCYENKEQALGYCEDDAMGGFDPYSSSKGCAELITASYRRSYFQESGIGIASARAGNVIGGGDWAEDRLIPDMLRAIEVNQSVIIRSPSSIRPWQHVLEPLAGYLQLAEALYNNAPQYSSAWNFGSYDTDAKSVEWIVQQMTSLWGEGASYVIDKSAANLHEAHYLKLNCSKTNQKLKWHPKWNLKQALEKIVIWHREYLKHPNMEQISLEQINDYMTSSYQK